MESLSFGGSPWPFTQQLGLQASGCDQANVIHKLRLLSDNGSSYIATYLADWLHQNGMQHVRGTPYHPQTQGKIERWHQLLKNRIMLESYVMPGQLELEIGNFVSHYNNHSYFESLNNLTPADVYFSRGQAILLERERIKRNTLQTVACNTAITPHNITNQMSQTLA